jgi:uncharacterized membrane protein (DUF2068 family)
MNEPRDSGHRDLGITLIALFKFLKALLLLAVALGAIGLLRGGVPQASDHILEMFSSGAERNVALAVVGRITAMSPKRIGELGIVAFLYAVVFLVEGTGLWLQRRWAEYLTIIVTASLIPFEIYELMHGVTAARVATVVVNVAVVVYLIVRLRRRSKGKVRTDGSSHRAAHADGRDSALAGDV